MSFALLVPSDDSEPIVLRGMSEGATISAQARELFDGLWEVVRARGLHQLAPELSAVMLVDEYGHAKGLPLNRRGGAEELSAGEPVLELRSLRSHRRRLPLLRLGGSELSSPGAEEKIWGRDGSRARHPLRTFVGHLDVPLP